MPPLLSLTTTVAAALGAGHFLRLCWTMRRHDRAYEARLAVRRARWAEDVIYRLDREEAFRIAIRLWLDGLAAPRPRGRRKPVEA